MLRLSNLLCCSNDAHFEEPHEMALLQEVNRETTIPSLDGLDGSSHWKGDSTLPNEPPEEVHFIFGGNASNWLCPEPVEFSDANPDSILICDDGDDGAVYDDSAGQASASSDILGGSSEGKEMQCDVGNAEQEIDEMINSPTDPVGKFLRQQGLTGARAVELNIHRMLLNAPKTPRQKYGPRQEQTAEKRMQLSKDRNRAHAKATRQRKKLYEKILLIMEGREAGRGSAVDDSEGAMSEG